MIKIYEVIEKYKQYDLEYNVVTKILYTREPMIVSDFVNIRNIIKEYNLDIKEIRINGGGCYDLRY